MPPPDAAHERLDAIIKRNWNMSAIAVLGGIGCAKLIQQNPPPKTVLAALASLSALTADRCSDALEKLLTTAPADCNSPWRDWSSVEAAVTAVGALWLETARGEIYELDSERQNILDERSVLRAEVARLRAKLKIAHAAISSCVPEGMKGRLEQVDPEALYKEEGLDDMLGYLPHGARAVLLEMLRID